MDALTHHCIYQHDVPQAVNLTHLTFSIAASVSMRPNVQMETVTLLFFIANSCSRAPKKPFKADFVEAYGATKGLDNLPVERKQLSSTFMTDVYVSSKDDHILLTATASLIEFLVSILLIKYNMDVPHITFGITIRF